MAAGTSSKTNGNGVATAIVVAPNLEIRSVAIADLKEQDINARVMDPREFERLIENIRQRGALESFPYCVGAGTKLLTRDLRWVNAEAVSRGDWLLGFDEESNGRAHRCWRETRVVATSVVMQPSRILRFDDGTEVLCSQDHRWLCAGTWGSTLRWLPTSTLRVGARVRRLTRTWREGRSWESGYLAGAFDGEGWLCQRRYGQAYVNSIGLAQNDNAMLAEIRSCLQALGIQHNMFRKGERDEAWRLEIRSRPELLRLLGMTRPRRLLSKFDANALGVCLSHGTGCATVVSVEDVGSQEVVAIKTTTGTYVAEGLASHNCCQPESKGPVQIVSGHHRVRAARAAGLTDIYVLVDTEKMTRSEIVAKQLAHNFLAGRDDADVLSQLIAELATPDDMLASGAPQELLDSPEHEAMVLFAPHLDFESRTVTFGFMPHQQEELETLIEKLGSDKRDLVVLGDHDQFEQLLKAASQLARVKKVLAGQVAITLMVRAANEQIAEAEEAEVGRTAEGVV